MSAGLDQYTDRYGRPITPTPYFPAQEFTGDVDGKGKLLSNLAGLQVGYLTSKELWIGIRSAGLRPSIPMGSGSRIDPLDASNAAKFDAILAARPAGSITHILDGEYQSYGTATNNIPASGRLYGAGMDATVLKRAVDATNYHLLQGTGSGIEVEGLTIDEQASVTSVIASPLTGVGLNIFGQGRIRNVRLTNGRSDQVTLAFHLAIFASGASSVQSIIEYCQVDNVSGYGTMIALGQSDNTYQHVGGKVLRNHIRACENTGIFAPGVGIEIAGNSIEDVLVGINWDYFKQVGCRTSSNFLRNIKQHGIIAWANNATTTTSDACIISDNTIMLDDNSGIVNGVFNAASGVRVLGLSALNNRLEVSGNRVYFSGTANSERLAFWIANTANSSIIDNLCSGTLSGYVTDNATSNFRNNSRFNGASIPGNAAMSSPAALPNNPILAAALPVYASNANALLGMGAGNLYRNGDVVSISH